MQAKRIYKAPAQISADEITAGTETELRQFSPADVKSVVDTHGGGGGGSGTVTSVAVSGSDGIEVDSGSPVTSSGTVALGVNASALLTHINVEAGADVTDAANVAGALSGASLTAATVASGDKVLVQDADDSDNLKTVTAQAIADLGGGGGGVDWSAEQVSSATDGSGGLAFHFNTNATTAWGTDPLMQLDNGATETYFRIDANGGFKLYDLLGSNTQNVTIHPYYNNETFIYGSGHTVSVGASRGVFLSGGSAALANIQSQDSYYFGVGDSNITGLSTLNMAVGISTGGVIMMQNLPTSDPANAGQLWNDSGTLKVSAG